MACTSASPVQKKFKYDVFLSFRGEDVRKTFVDHLYHALHNRGIITYKDDEKIQKGKRIDDQLMTSIEDSRIYIIVFSKNYASSSWCLDELVHIMECQRTKEQTAYPIFFNVEPTEVRHQSGAVGEAFAKHEKEEAAGIWRNAMKEAADLAGRELKTTFDGHEARFIQKVVEDISLELRFIDPSVDEKLIGMDTRVKDVVSSLEAGNSDDVHIIGIKGIGGGGKTTLARAVFNHISGSFEGKSFVENVREVSKSSGLKGLQKRILKDVLNDKNIDVASVHDGKIMMKKMMGSRKVLVVLDDVDDIEQLEALAGEHNWFKSGSTIIITTRDEHVLVAYGVKSIHDVNLLSHEEGVRLFSKYAFGREIPIVGYEKLSRKVVHYAAGLPLTIKVLGSSLCGKTECEWNDAIERLKTIPEKQTLKRLELSYSGLEHDHKEVFLEVACILKGEQKDKAIRILESCRFHARFALKVLEQKSLITVSNYGYLDMHDRIEEMGRNIVRRLHPHEPERHNRLWVKEEIENILVNELGTKETLSIKLMYTDLPQAIIMKGLIKMKKLRVLYIKGIHSYLKKFLENELEMGLDISQLWEGGNRKVLNELKFLELADLKFRTFDLGLTTQLETLNLVSCDDLVQLHMPVESLKLKSLWVCHSKLSKLELGLTPQLESLDIQECNDLVELHLPVESPKLRSLVLHDSMLSKLELGLTPQLESLDIQRCNDLVELHLPVESPKLRSLVLYDSMLSKLELGLNPQLESLDIQRCNDLVELHLPVESPKLRSLVLWDSKLSKLDLGLTPQLESLDLRECNDLVELHLPVESPKLRSLVLWDSKLSKLDLGLTPQLESLDIQECNDLVELHLPVESPKLRSLVLHDSMLSKLELGLTPQLESLDIQRCNDLVELHLPVESPKLRSLVLYDSMLSKLELGLNPQLESLDIQRCNDLVELHLPVESPKLRSLVLWDSKLSKLDLGLTPQLESLDLRECNDLVELHLPVESPKLRSLVLWDSKLSKLDLGLTPQLESLDIQECNDLVELHLPVESPKLRSLVLHDFMLSKLELGLTPQLESLDIQRCNDLVELHLPVESPKLRSLVLYDSMLSKLELGLNPQLESLDIQRCNDLVELHLPVESPKLRSLVLWDSKLSKLDLGLTPQLESLDLRECNDLVELHLPVESPKLRSLVLWDSKLSKLDLGLTPQLESLDIQECNDLVELHLPVESPKLRSLVLHDSMLSKLELGLTPQLESLDIQRCNDLVELHLPVESPKLRSLVLYDSMLSKLELGLNPQLESLDIQRCNDLVELHLPVESPKLGCLIIWDSKLSKLDLGLTPQLESLDLRECNDLVELRMPVESPKLGCLIIYGSKLSKLELGLTPQLESLRIEKCYNLQEIHAPVGCLEKLVYFKLSGCLRFEHFVVSNWYALPSIDSLATVELIAESLDICPQHPNNNLPKFQFKCFYEEPLPSSSGNLDKLLFFRLCACTNLESFSSSICGLQRLGKLKLEGSIPKVPKDLYQLQSLEELTLSMKEIKHLPDSICMLKHLKCLNLKSCCLLEQLPMELGRLECLEKLVLTECIHLRDIPDSICKMRKLMDLDLRYCILVEKLPEESGHLVGLRMLDIEGAGISRLPESIFQLKDLYIFGSRWRLESYGFTSLRNISPYTAFCCIKDLQH